jgi:RNA polymerase sigma-70 factor (ECF subfamily)
MAEETGLDAAGPDVKPAAGEADFELVRRYLADGDARAFAELIRRHLPMVRRLLAGLLRGEPEELEDAEQEVLLAVSRGLAGFRFQSSLATWIYSLARCRALDLLRRGRRRRRGLERLRLLEIEPPADPLEPLLAGERSARLLRAFRGLPAGDRQLVLMRDVEGFSMEQIAGLLRAPVGTVKSRLHRARVRLARALED